MDVTETTACLGTFAAHDADRSMFQREFCRRVLAEPEFDGIKLDVGCGRRLGPWLDPLRPRLGVLDGVDPQPSVKDHPLLRNRWHSTLEEADIPAQEYDLAYAFNVLEHVATPKRFFAKLRSVLKKDGVFWALTPHSRHPFAKCVRLVENIKLKGRFAKASSQNVNEYPAFYRVNRVEQLRHFASGAGFRKMEVVYMPCVQWDRYFPKFTRFVPHVYDRIWGLRVPARMLLLGVRLQ